MDRQASRVGKHRCRPPVEACARMRYEELGGKLAKTASIGVLSILAVPLTNSRPFRLTSPQPPHPLSANRTRGRQDKLAH
ncbi:unnamed protein product [Protopolystoma xenopodis]|uniref:Uncharacterized protein n=1 Tax=Protopolystoma xenopodis TaxID=117903 RepID=A0A3S5FDK0_9PLAT|nr:unnamed protein product [Protopolystoma xenopodis]